MNLRFYPSKASGSVNAPPSKSMAHRLLICAALSRGESTVKGIEECDDVRATINCLENLGAKITKNGNEYHIVGFSPFDSEPSVLDAGESASTLRFLLPIALLSGRNTVIKGTKSLFSRPMQVYEDMCREKKYYFSKDSQSVAVKGKLLPGEYRIPGNISSQFISGLLFALPLLKKDSTIRLTSALESLPYVKMTLSALSKFGIKAEFVDEKEIFIPGNQIYSPQNVAVEGDFSNAAFYDALNFLGGDVGISGLDDNSLQGDKIYKKHFDLIEKGMPVINVSDCPDLAPILFALSAAKNGAVFTGTKRLSMKESNRSEAMKSELMKFGVSVTCDDDSVVVFPKEINAPKKALSGHGDHRIVMALSILLSVFGGEITGVEAVSKSNPMFFEYLRSLGINFEIINGEEK